MGHTSMHVPQRAHSDGPLDPVCFFSVWPFVLIRDLQFSCVQVCISDNLLIFIIEISLYSYRAAFFVLPPCKVSKNDESGTNLSRCAMGVNREKLPFYLVLVFGYFFYKVNLIQVACQTSRCVLYIQFHKDDVHKVIRFI